MVSVTFENPIYLWYLISIPMLIASHFYFLRYAKHKGMRFANFEALKRVAGEKILTKNYILLGLRMLILIALIFAAAGTTYWYQGQTSENDFVIALDNSASMTAQDIDPTRMQAAKDTINSFLDSLEENNIDARVGLITFSGAAYIEQLPTSDLEQMRTSVEEVSVRKQGGTDIAGAVVTGTNMLLNSDRGKSILLISDGSVTVTAQQDNSQRSAIRYAENEKVIIHSLGIGTETGPIGYLPEYYNASAVFKEQTLRRLANSTGGTFHMINTPDQRRDAYDAISEVADEAMIQVDLSYGLLLVALLLIFLEWGLVSTKFRRLP